jgi:type II secretory ATPase GspE/PulE/Tfp pilus assembly ATPase PilB-like protein
MGVKPFHIANSVVGVVAQNLVRRVCEACKEPLGENAPIRNTLTREAVRSGVELPAKSTFYRGAGCPQCRGTGYRGRVPIIEMLEMNDALATAILNGATREELRQVAVQSGFKNLTAGAARKLQNGETSVEEFLRMLDSSTKFE